MKAIQKAVLVLVMSIFSGVSFAGSESATNPVSNQVETKAKAGVKDSVEETAVGNIASAIAGQPGWNALAKEREFNTWHISYTIKVTENKPYGKTIFQQRLSTLGTATAAFYKRELIPYVSRVQVPEMEKPQIYRDIYSDTTKAIIDTHMRGGELLSALEMEFSLNDPAFKKHATKIDSKEAIIEIPDSPESERIMISKTFSFKMEDIDKKPMTISISESPKMIVELVIARS